jgi:hypothetical protein
MILFITTTVKTSNPNNKFLCIWGKPSALLPRYRKNTNCLLPLLKHYDRMITGCKNKKRIKEYRRKNEMRIRIG